MKKLLFLLSLFPLTAHAMVLSVMPSPGRAVLYPTSSGLTSGTTLYRDTFTEASNTTNIAAHTMDTGPGWTGTDSNDGKLRINGTNDNLETTDSLDYYVMYVNGTPSTADYCTSWDLTTGADSTSDGNATIRYDYTGDTGYYAGVDKTGMWYLFRDGVRLASGTVSGLLGSFSTSTTYTGKLCGVGSTISFQLNGTMAKSTTDSTYTAAGNTGVALFKTSYKMDNFKVLVP